MKTKQCSHCKKRKSLFKFNKNKWNKDGLQNQCRVCTKAWNKEYRQAHKDDLPFRIHTRTKALEYLKKSHNTITGYLRHTFHKMNTRCTNVEDERYKYYGGLRIRCLFKNADDFINHVINDLKYNTLEKIGNLLLDRINKMGDFEPGNICFVTASQNGGGRRKQRTAVWGECSSIYKGVSRDNERNTWKAYVKVNGKYKHLGRFNSQLDAARAYDKAALKYFGEFALTNEMMGLL